MLQHRSFAVVAAFASIAFAAVPAFASPDRADHSDHNQAPVAMSGARQPDREIPVVDHTQPAHRDAAAAPAVAPVRAPIMVKAGFGQLVTYDGTAGFGVPVSQDVSGGRFGFASARVAPTADHARFGFATVVTQ
jgi:hypothetical protein